MKAKRARPSEEAIALRHADARACSIDGQVFVADAKGVFWVPAKAVAALRDHGFVPVDDVAG